MSGWPRPSAQARLAWGWLGLCVLGSPWAAIGSGKTSDEAPDVELLEFLSEWRSEEGAWIDPFEVEGISVEQGREGVKPSDQNETDRSESAESKSSDQGQRHKFDRPGRRARD